VDCSDAGGGVVSFPLSLRGSVRRHSLTGISVSVHKDQRQPWRHTRKMRCRDFGLRTGLGSLALALCEPVCHRRTVLREMKWNGNVCRRLYGQDVRFAEYWYSAVYLLQSDSAFPFNAQIQKFTPRDTVSAKQAHRKYIPHPHSATPAAPGSCSSIWQTTSHSPS
jgi:hypothetical protein